MLSLSATSASPDAVDSPTKPPAWPLAAIVPSWTFALTDARLVTCAELTAVALPSATKPPAVTGFSPASVEVPSPVAVTFMPASTPLTVTVSTVVCTAAPTWSRLLI